MIVPCFSQPPRAVSRSPFLGKGDLPRQLPYVYISIDVTLTIVSRLSSVWAEAQTTYRNTYPGSNNNEIF